LEVARDLCAGLAAMHDRGVVHRDLKPANVMIDGRGRARLTDLGLAVALEAPGQDLHAGTPAYMSPEQLAGREVTVRSDLYALGLLLYEVFTGRRFFDVRTLEELLQQHHQSKEPRLQSASRLVDAAVERAIHQCLEEDATGRPSSARAVLAMLPGGDALDAAVAAGETPSPDMVAAAGKVGDLSPTLAWLAVAAVIAGYAAAAALGQKTTLLARAPLPKPPEVLVERSREILMRLRQDSMADWAYSFEVDSGFLEHVRRVVSSPEEQDKLLATQPGPILFAYRQSPQRLVAANRDAAVTRRDPPADVPGMAEVVLDPRGRLLNFQAVPPHMEEPGDWPEPDWSALFQEAGLDAASLRSVPPRWAAPVDSDRKAAWSGMYPGGEREPVRVEAAAYHGRPVWFAVLPPWAEESRAQVSREPASSTPFRELGLLLVALAVPLGGLLLVRRNLRLGRSDSKGAFRVASFVFASYGLARLCRADHVAAPGDEVWIMIKVLSYPALWAIVAWLMYVALEPYARRRWPHLLISWKRALAGQFRDPLVGRDVLLGAAAGCAGVVMMRLGGVLAAASGALVAPEPFIAGPTLTSLRHVFFRLFVNQYSAVQYALMYVFLLVLLRVLLRSAPLALAAWCALGAAPFLGGNPSVAWVAGIMHAGLMLLVLMRVGLLGLASTLFVLFSTVEVPLPVDLRAWYALRGWPVVLAGLGLAVYGFHVSLAGKSPFGAALED
jgi:serine/threonine-protein kinase